MSENKSSNKSSGIAAGIAMAASIIPFVKPALEAVCDYADKAVEERKNMVAIPELYSKEYPLSVEQAVEILENYGLKATLIKMPLTDAAIQYRHCFDFQVIKSHPKAKQKVERGTTVLVKYITQETIDESRRMFETVEKQKEELSFEKQRKKAERKEHTKEIKTEVLSAMQNTIKKVPATFLKSDKKEDKNEKENESK